MNCHPIAPDLTDDDLNEMSDPDLLKLVPTPADIGRPEGDAETPMPMISHYGRPDGSRWTCIWLHHEGQALVARHWKNAA